ncbi:MAG: diacylglycerol kinase family protein, partial [Planctomycetota bacterium]
MMEQDSATRKTVLISKNPKSGASDQSSIVDALADHLESVGFLVHVLTDISELKKQVDELQPKSNQHPSQLQAVVAAGGDGTVSLLANELPAETPLAILPLGTENLLAKYLCLRADPVSIAETIRCGHEFLMDVGSANGKLFLVMLSCGFDADVVNRLHSNRKGHIQHWSYVIPILQSIWKYRYPKIKIRSYSDDAEYSGKWAFLFNVPRYAMNIPFVPQANPCDGALDVITFHGGNTVRGLFYLFTVLIRKHLRWG